jgi:hypothetical protein
MTQVITLKLATVRAILMRVSDFGEMTSVTSNLSSKDPLSSPRMFIIGLSFLISFFVWDKTMTSSTFAFKIKTA